MTGWLPNMRKALAGVLVSAGLLGLAPDAAAGTAWVQVGTDIRSGVSGFTVLARGERRLEALIVRDNKKDGQNRLARVRWQRGQTPKVEPLTWPGEQPVDLESLDPVPGRPGEFVALASAGKGFHFRLESGAVSVLGTFQVPGIQPGDDYESFALTLVQGRMIALWADRGQDLRLARLSAAEFDPATRTFGPAQSVQFRAPSPAQHVRHISDLDVTRSGELVVSSAADPGDDGPFTSAVHVIGRLGPGPRLTLAPKPRTLGTYPGYKIEALTCLSGSCDSMLLGTDDENLGGHLRLT